MNLLVSKWIRSCEGGGEEVMPACHVGTALETWSSSGGGSLRHCRIPGGCEALLICWNKLLCKKCRWALCDSKQNVIRCVLVDSSAGTQKPLPQIAILASSLTLSWKEQGGYMCWVGWEGIMFTVVTESFALSVQHPWNPAAIPVWLHHGEPPPHCTDAACTYWSYFWDVMSFPGMRKLW